MPILRVKTALYEEEKSKKCNFCKKYASTNLEPLYQRWKIFLILILNKLDLGCTIRKRCYNWSEGYLNDIVNS